FSSVNADGQAGSKDSDAVSSTELCDGGTVRVPFEFATTPERWRKSASIGAVSRDRKSTRLNSSHVAISYAVFCLKKKNTNARGSTSIKRVVEIIPRRRGYSY